MIWLIGGTSEGVIIAQRLTQAQLPWLVTVTTPAGAKAYESLQGGVRVGPLTLLTLPEFLQDQAIDLIIDASHPFAVEISRLAIRVSQEKQIPYLRFEREELPLNSTTEVLPDLASVIQPQYLQDRRVLLTVGVRPLALFQPWLQAAQIWARILPESWELAVNMGFPAQRLIPMRLPVSVEREKALWLELEVDTVIAKSSGIPGGLEVKQEVAAQLGVRLIVIERPRVQYPAKTEDVEAVVAFCRAHVSYCQSD